jgi:hypothetical protein
MLLRLLIALAVTGSSQPAPELTPEQVIRIQLDALKTNDARDGGIRTVFLFASPGNRASSGPIERFIAMVKNPVYRPMLNYRRDETAAMRVRGDQAQQKVTVIGAEGRATYLFLLTRQKEKPYTGCWMTDSVIRIEEGSSNKSIAKGTDARYTPVVARRFARRSS